MLLEKGNWIRRNVLDVNRFLSSCLNIKAWLKTSQRKLQTLSLEHSVPADEIALLTLKVLITPPVKHRPTTWAKFKAIRDIKSENWKPFWSMSLFGAIIYVESCKLPTKPRQLPCRDQSVHQFSYRSCKRPVPSLFIGLRNPKLHDIGCSAVLKGGLGL